MSAVMVSNAVAAPVRARSTRGWTAVGLILAVVLIVGVAASFVGSIAYEPIVPTHRVFGGSIHAVEIDVENGSVTIDPAASGAVVSSSGVSGLSTPTDREYVTAGTLIVRSSCPTRVFENHCTRSYVVGVAASDRVVVDTDSGDVVANGVTGALTIYSGQGNVTVDGSTGPVHVATGQGDVTARGLKGAAASASSGQGSVYLGFAAPPSEVTATSGQGDVSIVVPRGATAYQVQAASSQGPVTDDLTVDPTSRRVIRATSGQGDVSLSYRV